MKKLTALLVAGVMTIGMTMTAFANPSISTIATEQVEVSAETAAVIPEGKKIVVTEVDPEKYESKEAAEVVTKVNDEATKITMKEILETLKVDTTAEIKTESGNVVDPTVYEPITKFADLVITDGTSVEYDVDGEVVSAKVTLTIEALKDADVENLLIMQINPKTGEVYFIEIDEEDFDPETGEITVTFPCLGPFTILEK
ncbi:MAG: hypothetical protein Q4C61_05850 [Lachnospiraceae bacterium]|nr:hypothetical protein [Lachnospiraceae bacterium]